jgi:PAS domain-containing protein
MATGLANEGSLDDKIFEAVSAGIICLDREMRIIRCNCLGARSIGAGDDGADITGKLFDEVVKTNFENVKAAFRKVLEDKKPRVFWGFPVNAGNHEKTFWDYKISELDGGVLLSAVEASDRIQGEYNLQSAVDDAHQYADELQSIVAQMTDGLIVFDAGGEVVKMNQAAADLLGEAASIFEPGQKKTRKKTPLITRLDGKTFPAGKYPWQLACAKGKASVNVEMRVRRRADSEAIISINAAPLRDKKQNISGAVEQMGGGGKADRPRSDDSDGFGSAHFVLLCS